MFDLSTFTSSDQTPLNTITFPATILTSTPQVLWQYQQWTSMDQALLLSSPLNVLLRLFPLLHEIYFSALISTLQYFGLFCPPNLPFPGLSPSVSSDIQSLDFNYLEVMNLFENPLSIKNLYMIPVHDSYLIQMFSRTLGSNNLWHSFYSNLPLLPQILHISQQHFCLNALQFTPCLMAQENLRECPSGTTAQGAIWLNPVPSQSYPCLLNIYEYLSFPNDTYIYTSELSLILPNSTNEPSKRSHCLKALKQIVPLVY